MDSSVVQHVDGVWRAFVIFLVLVFAAGMFLFAGGKQKKNRGCNDAAR